MTHIKLIRSGGIMGVIRSAETDTDIGKNELITAFKNASAEKSIHARDAENCVVYVNEERFVIDADKLKDPAKKIIDDLEKNLKAMKL